MNFLSPNLERENSIILWPTFRTVAHFSYKLPRWAHFTQMGSHSALNTTTNPCSLLSCHKLLSGLCKYTKYPQPTLKHHISWPELESEQNELRSGQNGPQLGKMLEKWAKLYPYDALKPQNKMCGV